MRRRAFLSTCATVAFGGCFGIRSHRPQPTLAWIWLRNDRDEAHEIDVVVTDNDETVFSEQYELGVEPDSANIHREDIVAGPGAYVVHATLDGVTHDIDTTAHVDGDEKCIGVRFSLLNNGQTDYWVKSMQQC
jgi:hypothetical protein